MSIFDNLIERATGLRTRNGFERRPMTVNLEHGVSPDHESYMEEHEIMLKIVVRYNLLSGSMLAEEREAREVALRRLRATLYGDLLQLQSELMHAISNGDRVQAATLCGRLRTEIMG